MKSLAEWEPRFIDDEGIAVIRSYYGGGSSIREIAEIFGISRNIVSKVIRKYFWYEK
jgi:transposase